MKVKLIAASVLVTLLMFSGGIPNTPYSQAKEQSSSLRLGLEGARAPAESSAPKAAPATCFCKVTANGKEVDKPTDAGYNQLLQKEKCRKTCRALWDNASNDQLLQWAKASGQCGNIGLKMYAAVGTADYEEVRSKTINVPCAAPPTPTGTEKKEFKYAVKFVCGNSGSGRQSNGLLAPGQYFTAINVHNSSGKEKFTFRKKFAIALPREQVGTVSGYFKTDIGPDQALEIDCADILGHAGTPNNPVLFLKGFAIIESPFQLDIVAVYTAGDPNSGVVSTLDIERVPGYEFAPGCAGDLNLDASTSKANWMVVAVPVPPNTLSPQLPFPAVPVSSPPWLYLNPNAPWYSALPSSGAAAPPGYYDYELTFCLCKEFTNARISLMVQTDNDSQVSLNGNPPFGTYPGNLPFAAVAMSTTSGFVAGKNTLTIRVRNDGNTATGFAIAGTIAATNGLCF